MKASLLRSHRLLSFPFHSDFLCPRTLYNAFTKAKQPEKVFIRVLQQRDPEVDGDCLEDYCKMVVKDRGDNPDTMQMEEILKDCPYANQVFIHEIHAKEAAGPTWARGLLSKHVEAAYKKGEVSPQDHCMSLDSHMDFEPHWDDRMVKMWEDAENEYAVLSTYVQDIEHLGEEENGNPHHQVPHLCMITYTSNVRTHATKCVNDLVKPKLTNAVWGAGLSFSKCHADLKVQVDPHTPHIFDGEEFNRAARFFTYGYDVYTPNHVFVLHDYHKSQANPIMHTWHQNSNVHGSFAEANKRLRTMIDLPHGEQDPEKALRMKQSKFGLGDRRSLDQLIQFSGFDLRHEKVSIDGKNRCGNIQWVPFNEHPIGVNYIPGFENLTEDPLDPYDATSIWYTVGAVAAKDTLKVDAPEKGNVEGLPEGMDLGKQHGEMQEAAEAGELANNGLDEKHEELMDQIRAAEAAELKADGFEAIATKELNLLGERKVADLVRPGPLRGIKHFKEHASVFIAKHPLKIEHGFSELPTFIKVNVFLLVFGVVFAIIKGAGKGRAFKRDDRKREL